MLSIKVKFKASAVGSPVGCLYYQIAHKGFVSHIRTAYRLNADEWDAAEERVVARVGDGESDRRCRLLAAALERDHLRFDEVVRLLDATLPGYGLVDIVRLFGRRGVIPSFCNFMQDEIVTLRLSGRVRTSETYASALRSFMRFREGCDISLDDLTAEIVLRYESFLRQTGVSSNTVSFYMRILRAAYNRAVERRVTVQRYPFRTVYTGVGKTLKRAVTIDVLRRVKMLDLSHDLTLDFSRDMFMFSFYTRGMSFVDMAYLRKGNLHDGFLVYRRRKTGQQLIVRWERCMQAIVDKYPRQRESDYLLPIIRDGGSDSRRQYENALHLVNRKLKQISARVDPAVHLTMYVARHSWASVAKSQNVPLAVISEAMGHDSETTTQIYLASLNNTLIDNANAKILRKL